MFFAIRQYIKHYLTATSKKGFGTHSPFMYQFIRQVLKPKTVIGTDEVEVLRKKLLTDNTIISVTDFGAGSQNLKNNERSIKQIAATSLKQKKLAALLQRAAIYSKSKNILELGTSLGITTAYLAKGDCNTFITTIEGDENISNYAKNNFKKLGIQNIESLTGDFDSVLPILLTNLKTPFDFIYIDGNHRYKPTLQYFEQLLPHTHSQSIFVFDDIYWNSEMKQAWEEIKTNSAVAATLDIFYLGFVFFNPDFKQKQHFKVRM